MTSNIKDKGKFKIVAWDENLPKELEQFTNIPTESFGCKHNFVDLEGLGTQCTKCEVWI